MDEAEAIIAGKCMKCGKSVPDGMHSCPYAADINNNDDPNYCNCCEECEHECAMDI